MLTHQQLSEAFDELWNHLIDPAEPYYDTGPGWLPLEGASTSNAPLDPPSLAEVRCQCRALAATNEFAINALENRISYLVGTGHTYRATSRKGCPHQPELCIAVQRVIDEFLRANRWQRRQQEIVRRLDRDGEVFLRLFAAPTGTLLVRFVEPEQVGTPADRAHQPAASHGIVTDPHDVESVRGYFVEGQWVPAEQIQHRKANVDANVKRGLPLFYPVRKNLHRAEKLLRNMSLLAEVQSAIALIRKHPQASRGGVQQFVAANNATSHAPGGAGTAAGSHVRRFAPGTILDAPSGVEYDFPAAALNAANYVAILQAELRAIAARLVMPEFMFTSDASNGNFASTLVAEGPAVRMFERLQADLKTDDLAIVRRAVDLAVSLGQLPADVCDHIELQVGAPSLPVRDQLQEAQAFRIEHQSGILSPQTWSQRRGLDYDQEQANLKAHNRT